MQTRRELRLVLFITAMVLVNYPFLRIIDREAFVLGIPVLYFGLFFYWAVIVLCTFILSRKPK